MAAVTLAPLQVCQWLTAPSDKAASRAAPASASFAPAKVVAASAHSFGSRRASVVVAASGEGEGPGAPVEVVDAGKGGKDGEQVDILPSGEWAHNFSILNYEDLSKHYEEKSQEPEDPSSPLLPDESHGAVSGEWSGNVGILSYEDLSAFFQQEIFKKDAKPDSLVADVMKRQVRTATPEDTFGELAQHFAVVTALPVIDDKLVCIGVVSRYDMKRAGSPSAKVKDFMCSPPKATMTPDKTVLYAAVSMLKNKVHSIPVVNDAAQLVGIVSRTDIFTVLESDPSLLA